jgi:hypothetical protein
MTARRLAIAVALVTAIGSGAYVFLYLYRWEWNRALIAGIVFIAAEIALLGIAILDRLQRVDRRLDKIEQGGETEQVLARIQETAPRGRRHFAWLTDGDRMGVFVPVLMGAGVLISILAWAVEKLAQRTGRPVLERRLADRLAPIALPEPGESTDSRVAPRKPALRIAGQLALAVVLLASVFALAGATQNRPDEIHAGTSSIVSLDVYTNGVDQESAVESLWQTCAGTTPSQLAEDSLRVSEGTAVSLELSPALGPYGERRLRGCLEDATLDKVQAAVLRVKHMRQP